MAFSGTIITNLAYFVIHNLTPGALPPISDTLTPVAKQADERGAFYNQYQPLIVQEVVASLRDALTKTEKKAAYRIHLEDKDSVRFLRSDDVTLVTLKHDKEQKRIDCTTEIGGFRFIVVEMQIATQRLFGILDIYEGESKISFKGNFKDYLNTEGARFNVVPLVSLVNLDRMYTVCTEMPDSPLLNQVR